MCLLTGLFQGQRTGAMWLVASTGPNDEGRGKRYKKKRNFIYTLFLCWYILKSNKTEMKQAHLLYFCRHVLSSWCFQILSLPLHVSINSNTIVTQQEITLNNMLLFCCSVKINFKPHSFCLLILPNLLNLQSAKETPMCLRSCLPEF